MKRVCPLLERETRTHRLDVAPAPWIVRECEETGLVFLENPPGYDSLKQDYAWEVTYEKQAASRQAQEPVLQAMSQATKRFRRQVMKRHKVADMATAIVGAATSPVINLVDIGCGEGDLLGIVMARLDPERRARCRPHGVEISNELARRSQANLQPFGGRCVHAAALQGLASFEADFFDLVVMSSFLEHEIQPLPVLREARHALRPGGRVLIKVPNYDCWNRRLRGRRWPGYRWPDHVNYFTPRTLRAIAEAAGLTVERMSWLDRFPTSDSLYAVLRKPAAEP